jgi:hypothetical protein
MWLAGGADTLRILQKAKSKQIQMGIDPQPHGFF